MREMVGRTLSMTVSVSLIWGVTLMMKPTATVLGVVVILVVLIPCVVLVSDLTVKYTLLSTTFSSAVWLFNTLILGLLRTRVVPNASSSLIEAEMLPICELALS